MERPFSLYAALGVPAGAPPAAVEAAYRSLMKRHHPDHAGPDSAARASEINAAFAVLRDPARRSAYDRAQHARQCAMLAAGAKQQAARRRPFARRSSWLAVAIAIGAGISLTANWYNGGIVPQRSAAAFAVAPAAQGSAAATADSGAAPDPIEHVADFLTEAARRRPGGASAAPPKRPRSIPAETARRPSAETRRLSRRAASPQPAPRAVSARPEADFLEREDFIY